MTGREGMDATEPGSDREHELFRLGVGLRIKSVREDVAKQSQADFAKRMEIGISTLQRWERGERDADARFLGRLSTTFGVRLDWLLLNSGNMWHSDADRSVQAVDSPPTAFWPNPEGEPQLAAWERWAGQVGQDGFVPVIYAPTLVAAAGTGVVNYQHEQETEALMFKRSFLQDLGVRPHQVFCMRVKGDSMEPTLREGCIILVDTAQRRVNEGVYVIRVGDQLLVKRLQLALDGKIVVRSDNPSYSDMQLDAASKPDIIGRAIHLNTRL